MKSTLFVVIIASTLFCSAQQPATDPAMVKFFAGNWSCAGEFANGKKIEADLSFVPELDGKWLLYRHADRPPGQFKALAVWGVDQPAEGWSQSWKIISATQGYSPAMAGKMDR